MTRETKIGLLVGLAFIIVIGILLSDHFRSAMEPPQAALSSAASAVRAAVNSPGTANPPITMVTPADAPPKQPVPTRDELNPAPSPVIPSARPDQQPSVTPAPSKPDQVAGADAPSVDDALRRAARQHGEDVVSADPDASKPAQPTSTDTQAPTASMKTYKAQSGDSVSRMAAKLMGANTRAHRQAIIDANPSLRDDPDFVVVGQSYVIPTRAQAAAATPSSPAAPAAPSAPIAEAPSGRYFYTVQAGDSLWRIANDQLGDPTAVDAIKELNLSILKGQDHDVVLPGSKLRLPFKPVASAE